MKNKKTLKGNRALKLFTKQHQVFSVRFNLINQSQSQTQTIDQKSLISQQYAHSIKPVTTFKGVTYYPPFLIYNNSGAMWKPSFSTQELEYFSTLKANVTILPNFSDSQLYLISGRVGPFRANMEVAVPLWLALQLKSNQKCKLLPPFWLEQEVMHDLHEKEKRNPNELIYLQHQEFFQISYIYFIHAPDDVPQLLQLRALVEGLESMRREKIRKLFDQAKGTLSLKLINLTTYEANRIREPLSRLGMMAERLAKP